MFLSMLKNTFEMIVFFVKKWYSKRKEFIMKDLAIVIILAVVAFVLLIAVIVLSVKYHQQQKAIRARKASEVNEEKGVRYSVNETIVAENGEQEVSFLKQDIILKPRQLQLVTKEGPILPGKYTVLSSNEHQTEINIRIDLQVKTLHHGDEIVLAEGQQVGATTTTIILR